MQYQMSTVSIPSSLPATPPAAPVPPQLLEPAPRKPRKARVWIWVALAIVLTGVALWVAKQQRGAGGTKQETAAQRTFTIATGDLEKTVRVSGVIVAERFAAIMAPRLRGGRGASGTYGSGAGKSLAGGTSSSTTLASTSAASSGTPSGTSSGSASNQSGAAPTSTNTALNGQSVTSGAPGAPASSLGAIRGTQNRFGDRAAAQGSGNKSATTATGNNATTSATLGPTGMGTTSSNLIGTGGNIGGGGGGAGGGGGMSGDFSLVLLEVAKPGSHVKKGEIVAEFDRQYQLNRLDDYKATVIQLDADVKKMKANLAVAKDAHDQLVRGAKADWDKALLDLKTAEVRSAIEAEDLKLAADEGEARYKQVAEEARLVEASQRAQILVSEIERDQAKLELDRATMNVDRMVVRAPMDGIVVMQSIWRGGDFGQVQQGDQVWPGMTFMQIVDPSSMVLMANLNQVDAESVRLGIKATARLDAYPGVQFPAHVIGVNAMTKPGVWRPNYMREIPVRLKLDQIDARVIPDISASADLQLASEKQATLAPLSAVFYEHTGANPFVFLQTPSGWERRQIELGLSNHVTAVVNSGLRAGDVVAVERPEAGEPPSPVD